MLEYFLKILIIMLVLFSFMLPGFILRKARMLKDGAILTLTNVLLYVCQPILTVKAFAVDPVTPTLATTVNMLAVFLLSFVGITAVFFISKLALRGVKEVRRRDVYCFAATFSNCGFLGIPFVDMFTGGNSEAIMYVAVYSMAFNILIWTLGVYLMTQDRKRINLRAAFLNPSMIGGYVGLLLFFLPQINVFDMPAVAELRQIPVYFSAMTSVLSMLIVGVRIADMPFKSIFNRPGGYLACAIRLVVSPLVMYFIAFLTDKFIVSLNTSDCAVVLALVVASAMSPASSCVAYAEKFNGDGESATSVFVLGTLLSIISVPIVMTLLSAALGL